MDEERVLGLWMTNEDVAQCPYTVDNGKDRDSTGEYNITWEGAVGEQDVCIGVIPHKLSDSFKVTLVVPLEMM